MRSMRSALVPFVPLAALALALPTSAQLTSVVPPVSPQGAWVPITMDNATLANFEVGQACPFEVRTAGGALIYNIDCPSLLPFPVPSGGVTTFYWQQTGNDFNPVPAGDYVITVELPDGTLPTHPITIGGIDAGVALLGQPRVGTSRDLFLHAPGEPGQTFFMGASASTAPGIPSCAGIIPLTPDAVLTLSLTPGNGVFNDFAGILGGIGESYVPSMTLPNNPALVGFPLAVSYVTVDLSGACIIGSIAAPYATTLQA